MKRLRIKPRQKQREPGRKCDRSVVHSTGTGATTLQDQLSVIPITKDRAIIEEDDPYEFGKRRPVIVNFRDDPLRRLKLRNQIDNAQYMAGRAYQKIYEDAQLGGMKGMLLKTPVDGGLLHEPLTDKHKRSVKMLTDSNSALGMHGRVFMEAVLCHGESVTRYVGRVCDLGPDGAAKSRDVEFYGRYFRQCLETLAVLYNLAAPRGPAE